MKQITFEKIILNNFRQHLNLEMDLSENKLLMVIGPNGSGKTTIIDAIIWVLFDETTKGSRGDVVVNNKIGKDCSVQLIFRKDNDVYDLTNYRKHKKYKNGKVLLLNGSQISTDADVKSTNDIIEKLFISKDIFLNCMLFSQYISRSFVSMSHSGQKEILDTILMFNKFDEYQERVNKQIDITKGFITDRNYELMNIEASIDYHNTLIEENKESLLKRLTELKEEYENKSKEKNDLELEIKKLEHEVDEQDLTKLNNDILKLNNEITLNKSKEQSLEKEQENELKVLEYEINKKIDSAHNNLKQYFEPKIDELKNKIIELENQKSINVNKIEEIKNSNNKDLNNIINKLNENINKVNDIKHDTIHKLNTEHLTNTSSLSNKINEIKAAINSLENNIYRHNKDIEVYNNDKEVIEKSLQTKSCSKCNQILPDIEQLEKELNVLNNKILMNNKEVVRSQSECRQFNDELISLETTLKNSEDTLNSKFDKINVKSNEKIAEFLNKIEEEKNNYSKKLNTDIHDINKLIIQIEYDIMYNNKTIGELKRDFNTQKSSINFDHIFNEKKEEIYNKYHNKLIELQEQLNTLNKDLFNLTGKKNVFDNYEKDINNKKIELNKISENLKMIAKLGSTIKEDTKKIINQMNDTIKNCKIKIKEKKKEVKILNEKMEILKFWKKGFSDVGIKSILMDESIPLLNKKARELSDLCGFLRVNFSPQTTLKSGKSNNKFSISVVHTSKLSEYSELSAGETKIANIIILLCLRHLLEYMSGYRFNIILLDEILDSLDEQNSPMVVEIFQELAKDYLVLLITHTQKDWIQSDEQFKL